MASIVLPTPPQPFRISVPDEALDHLQQSLALAHFPDELDGAGWDYGVPLAEMKRLVAYWKDGFDWRKSERELNDALPQFTRDVEVEEFGTLNIHFVHKRSGREGALPLLFLHGWPGSFLEVKKILPLLTADEPGQPSFDVVAPSHPNFGFSEGVSKKGFNIFKYAEAAHKLMLGLGYTEYVVQGGDWGYLISRMIASRYGPQHCKAWHTNMPVTQPPKPLSNPLIFIQMVLRRFSESDKAGFVRMMSFREKGNGYYFLQGTKPQTLGYSLASSPVGLLAWVYEKLHEWSDDYPWTDDEILTWISIYWFSRAGPAAASRIYYEVSQQPEGEAIWARDEDKPSVPLGLSIFPKELMFAPAAWRPLIGNLVYENSHTETGGGHFAAYEKPEALVGDLRAMFGKGGPAFGVVKGRGGYE